MNQPKVDPAKIRLLGIKVFKEHLDCSEAFLEQPVEVKNYVFGHRYEQALELDTNRIRVRLYLSLKALNTDKEEVGLEAEYGLELFFSVANLQDFVGNAEEETVALKGGLAPTLAGIAYSTSRGILWEKLSGTYLSDIVLPVINPNDLIRSGTRG